MVIEPLTPLDCDLRDFAFMPLDVVRLRDSDLAAMESPEACWAAVLLWCASWHQIPAASLPDDDRVLANLAGFGRVVKEWQKIRDGSLRGWVVCSDGRLYHPVIAEKALDAWSGKQGRQWRTECARIKKHAQRHEIPYLPPEFDQWISDGCPQGQTLHVPRDKEACPQGQTLHVPRDKEACPQGQILHVPEMSPGKSTPKGKGQGKEQGKEQGDSINTTTKSNDLSPPVKMPTPPASAKTGTQLGSDWVLPKAWGEWALAERPDLHADDVRLMAEMFRDHWVANANRREGKKADWQAAWRNWVRGQKSFVSKFKTPSAVRVENTDKAFAEFLAGSAAGVTGANIIDGEAAHV